MAPPNAPKKSNMPMIVGALVVVGGIAFAMSGGDSGPATTKPAASDSPKKAAAQTGFVTADDYKRHDFAPVEFAAKDVFTPLVGNPTTLAPGAAMQLPTSELTIPPNFTAGEPNWAFTGTVVLNGKPEALVENSTTGEGDYLATGARWKSSSVVKISENHLTLRDASGTTKALQMQADVQAEINAIKADFAESRALLNPRGTPPNTNPNAAFDPTALTGPIGAGGPPGDVTLQPQDAGVAAAVQTAPPQNQRGRGGRGRGGRGRGRGGFGG